MKSKSLFKAALVASTSIAALTGGQVHAVSILSEGTSDWGLPNAPTSASGAGITGFSAAFGNSDGLDFLALSGLDPSTSYTLTTLTVSNPRVLADVGLCSSTNIGPPISPNGPFNAFLAVSCSTIARQFTTSSAGTINVGFVAFSENLYSYTVGLAPTNGSSGNNPVPLPGSAALLGVGLAAAAGLRRRKHSA